MAQDNDKEFEDYLKRDHALSEAYRKQQGGDGPSADIDAAILAEARKAVGAGPRKGGGFNPFGGHWMVPASLAAVLVLSISTVLFMRQGPFEQGMSPAGYKQGYAPMEQAAPEPMPEPTPEDRAPESVMMDRAAEPALTTKGTVAPSELQKESAPAPSKRQAGKAEPKPSFERPNVGPETDHYQMEQNAPEQKPVAPEFELREEAVESPAVQTAPMESNHAKQKPASRAFEQDPDKWLDYILKLKQQGEHKQVQEELKRFRSRYPDHTLPVNLQN